jgi:hypothetical protein
MFDEPQNLIKKVNDLRLFSEDGALSLINISSDYLSFYMVIFMSLVVRRHI